VRGHQGADQFYVRIAHLTPLYYPGLCHGAKYRATCPDESSKKEIIIALAFYEKQNYDVDY
jgi:hypothetical protein